MSASPGPGAKAPALHKVGAVIVAAGRGARMGGEVPKQYQRLGGHTVLSRTLAALGTHAAISEVVVVLNPNDSSLTASALAEADLRHLPPVRIAEGRATRAASVAAGLDALSESVTHVLIHDAARPFVSHALIDRILSGLKTSDGAAPALAVTDALWRETAQGTVAQAVPRTGLWRAQTPQAFALDAIRAAHRHAPPDAADDVEVARAAGLAVAIVPGDADNIKLTRPEDMRRGAQILAAFRGQSEASRMEIRLGNGYDVHRFGPGSRVVLCGIKIPHGRGLQGHSDADVGMHAVTDAIYGALAEGDIGQHFPPSDPQWKGAASDIFLRHAVGRAAERGFRIGNVDCTLVCERPKIGPHAPAMRARLAEIMGVAPDCVSVKATTSERLGFTGREEGIAALATATLLGPAGVPG